MKHYALALANKSTGEIEHMATSLAPLADDKIGLPGNHLVTHQLIRFEFDADPDEGTDIFRARQAQDEFEMNGANATEKSAVDATVRLKTGRNRATNIQVGARLP